MRKSQNQEILPIPTTQTICLQVRFGLDRLRNASRIRRNGVEVTAAWSDFPRHRFGEPKTTAAKRALSPDVMTMQARVCLYEKFVRVSKS